MPRPDPSDAPPRPADAPSAGAPPTAPTAALARLAAAPIGWGGAPIPAPIDDDAALVVDAYLAADGAGRARLVPLVDEDAAAALLVHAERLASLGVRAGESDAVRRGLAAVALAWDACPEIAHAVVALAVLYDAARRTGDPRPLFEEAAAGAPADVAPAFRDFLSRGDLDEIAPAMGFIEGADRGGFRYYRTW
jgi:hypothetical protein